MHEMNENDCNEKTSANAHNAHKQARTHVHKHIHMHTHTHKHMQRTFAYEVKTVECFFFAGSVIINFHTKKSVVSAGFLILLAAFTFGFCSRWGVCMRS